MGCHLSGTTRVVHSFSLTSASGATPDREAMGEARAMSRRHAVAATGVVLVGTMLIAACGTNRSEGDAAGSSCDTSKGTLVVGMIAPVSGSLSAIGLGMRNSADLAVKQANQKCTVPGYRLAF